MGPYLAQPVTEKVTKNGELPANKIRYSFCQMQGWRRTMQDAALYELTFDHGCSLFAVFDGHGGPEVSKYVSKIFCTFFKKSKSYKSQKYKQALQQTFKKIDQSINSKDGQEQLKLIKKKTDSNVPSDIKISMGCGCTAIVVLVTPTKLYTANIGDSRAVLCRKGNAVALSLDHKPQNQIQKNRIYNAGGSILNGRVNGGLNLSRSFGDFSYKQNPNKKYDEQLIICKPDVTQVTRSPNQDEFILIGCDGIWENYVNDSQPIIAKIHNQLKQNVKGENILKNLLDSLLAKETSDEKGCDNMTAILIEFL